METRSLSDCGFAGASATYAPLGRILSTSTCGRGMTCTDTSSPTRRAAAAPASVAAFTAPTSPRTITVTYPAPMYSLPIRMTLAALTIASAASIDPISPFVSISPSASDDIRLCARDRPGCVFARNSNRLREMRQLNYHHADAINRLVQHRHDYVLPLQILVGFRDRVCRRGHFARRVRREGALDAAGRQTVGRREPQGGAAWESHRDHL